MRFSKYINIILTTYTAGPKHGKVLGMRHVSQSAWQGLILVCGPSGDHPETGTKCVSSGLIVQLYVWNKL